MTDQTGPKPPPQHHPVPTPLALALGRLNVPDPSGVMIGKIAAPLVDKRYFAWVRAIDGAVVEIDETEAMALRNAGAEVGERACCPSCGKPAEYARPAGLHSDVWSCVGHPVMVYTQAGIDRAPDGSTVRREGHFGP